MSDLNGNMKMLKMKVKQLTSIDQECKQVGCSNDNLPDRELQVEDTASEDTCNRMTAIMKTNWLTYPPVSTDGFLIGCQQYWALLLLVSDLHSPFMVCSSVV